MKVGDWVLPERGAWDRWIAFMKYTEADHPYPQPQQILSICDKYPLEGCIQLKYPYRWWPETELTQVTDLKPEAPNLVDFLDSLGLGQ